MVVLHFSELTIIKPDASHQICPTKGQKIRPVELYSRPATARSVKQTAQGEYGFEHATSRELA